MSVYCISYTIKNKNNESLIEAIKSYGYFWREAEAVWFIQSTNTAKEVIENLRKFITVTDKLLVFQVYENWWGLGHSDEEYAWMKARTF